MPASRRVSQRQLEKLLDFAEANKDIALGRCTRGPQAGLTTQRAWESIAVKLNSVADGVTKSAEQWRRYWVELKAKTKAKGADIRRNASRSGGGPNKLAPLNDIEERILQIIGRVCVEGLPGVRIPFPIPSVSTSAIPLQPQPSTSRSLTPQMEVEWLEDEYFPSEILSCQLSLPQPPSDPSTSEIIRSPPPPSPTPPIPPPPTSPTPPIPPPPPSTRSYQPRSSPPPPQSQTTPLQQRQRAPSSQSSPLRRSRQRRICNRAVPQWARSMEERRMDIEERHASALEALSVTLDRRLANIEDRLREISDKLGNK